MKKLLSVGLLFAGIVGATAAVLAVKHNNDKKKEETSEEIVIDEIKPIEEKTVSKEVKDEFDKLCEESEVNKTTKKNKKEDAE